MKSTELTSVDSFTVSAYSNAAINFVGSVLIPLSDLTKFSSPPTINIGCFRFKIEPKFSMVTVVSVVVGTFTNL